jgi:MFS family permease
MKKPSLLVIFLTVFIDLVGFGIVLPLLPIYSEDFGAKGWLIGVIMASYSAMQFFFAPVWGRLSDRIGRRPVLRLTLFGGVFSYVTFAIGAGYSGSTGLIIFLVSRVMAGICGANITVAQAYIADITPPDKRSKGMGLIGMAFGLGFIFGPAIGSLSHAWFGMSGPGYVAAGFCGLSFLLAMFVLPESRRADTEPAPKRPRIEQWKLSLGKEGIALLVGVFFLATFGFTCFETTLGLLIKRNFNLDTAPAPSSTSSATCASSRAPTRRR